MIFIKLWREDGVWTWQVWEEMADWRNVTLVANGTSDRFAIAAAAASDVHDSAVAGRDAARSILSRGRK